MRSCSREGASKWAYRLTTRHEAIRRVLFAPWHMGSQPSRPQSSRTQDQRATSSGVPSTPPPRREHRARRTARDALASEVGRGDVGGDSAVLFVLRAGPLPKKSRTRSSLPQRSWRATMQLIRPLRFWCDKHRAPSPSSSSSSSAPASAHGTDTDAGSKPWPTAEPPTAAARGRGGGKAAGVLMCAQAISIQSMPVAVAQSGAALDADSGEDGSGADVRTPRSQPGRAGKKSQKGQGGAAGAALGRNSAGDLPLDNGSGTGVSGPSRKNRRGSVLQRKLGRGQGGRRAQHSGSVSSSTTRGLPPAPSTPSRMGHLSQCNVLVASHLGRHVGWVDRHPVVSAKNTQVRCFAMCCVLCVVVSRGCFALFSVAAVGPLISLEPPPASHRNTRRYSLLAPTRNVYQVQVLPHMRLPLDPGLPPPWLRRPRPPHPVRTRRTPRSPRLQRPHRRHLPPHPHPGLRPSIRTRHPVAHGQGRAVAVNATAG